MLQFLPVPQPADRPMNPKTPLIAIFFIAALTANTGASGQNHSKNQATASGAACPTAQTMKAVQLHGSWKVAFVKPPVGLPAKATMRLEQHAEFAESLAGTVTRALGAAAGTAAIVGHSPKAFLAGDLEDGVLLLDESSDNLSITGTWNGEFVKNSCGKVFKGTWKDTSRSAIENAPDVAFTLTRLP